MRVVILCLIYCLGANSLFAQQLEGKWKGYFSPNNSPFGKIYNYEMDITQGPQGQLTVSTYTKLSSDFSAFAYASGNLDKTTQLVHIEEQGFLDLTIQENHTPCLMNNFLIYKNIRGHEIIEGTYTSYNKKTGKDCGGGKIYLEKELPIQKLIASEKAASQKNVKEQSAQKGKETIGKNIVETKTINAALAPPKLNTPKPNNTVNSTIANSTKSGNNKQAIAKNNTVSNTKTNSENINTAIQNAQINSVKDEPVMEESFLNEPEDIETEIRIKQGNGFQTVPWALVARENKLAKKITTSSKQFSIDLYDNGTIDNDTIIVYDNKKLLVSKKRLSYKAIHLEFNLSEVMNEHEIIIVAHNMGTVPPNTALLVLKDGDRRQELFITSTNKINAKIIVSYTPPPKE
ncbi:MAG: hypothetical protein ACO239_06510 [Sediminibacterium sp.]|jgi:hypothetical protein